MAFAVLNPKGVGYVSVLGGKAAGINNVGPDQRQGPDDPCEDTGMVGHHKTGARGITIFIREHVDDHLCRVVCLFQLGQHNGEIHMRSHVQALPVRIVMTRGFAFQRRFGPVWQRVA